MQSNIKDELIQALIDQKEIFGDDLFDQSIYKRKPPVIKSMKKVPEEEISLFEDPKEDWEKAKSLAELNEVIKIVKNALFINQGINLYLV